MKQNTEAKEEEVESKEDAIPTAIMTDRMKDRIGSMQGPEGSTMESTLGENVLSTGKATAIRETIEGKTTATVEAQTQFQAIRLTSQVPIPLTNVAS